MEPFDPKKITDLGTLMLSLFDLILKCQVGFSSPDKAEQEEATAAVKKIISGFEFVIAMPAKSFRVELMGLYVEILIGMQVYGAEIIEKMELCQEKVFQLYKKKDIMPYL